MPVPDNVDWKPTVTAIDKSREFAGTVNTEV